MATIVPKLYAISSGNEKLPQALVEHALKDNPLDTPKEFVHASVTKIDHQQSGHGYQLTYTNHKTKKMEQENFDCVVLATPMHQKTNIVLPKDVKLPIIPYRSVDHSLFFGKLRTDVFGISSDQCKQSHLLSFLPTEYGYRNNHIGLIRSLLSLPANNSSSNERTWITFTEPDLVPQPKEMIPKHFVDQSSSSPVEVFHWLAYPIYHPVSEPDNDLGSFNPAPSLYYVNAIEQAASCMETAAIGGRNVALLIAHQYQLSHIHRDEEKPASSIFSFLWT